MGNFRVFTDLTKYKLSLAVTFSAVTGYFIYTPSPDLSLLFLIAGVFLLASGSAAMNQFSESEFDARMQRTRFRPIPSQRLGSGRALFISSILLLAGFVILMFAGGVPAILGALTVIMYNIVYTAIKKVSWFAVIPGALVGAIPPVIGYTAAGGIVPHADIVLFSLFMFLWQLPHFWLIIMKYRYEYQKAGFKTLPGRMTDRQVRGLVFLWVTVTTTFLLVFSLSGFILDRIINFILIPFNIGFILLFRSFLYRRDEKIAFRSSFILINSFSLLIMLLFIVNSILS